ncbi:MaoC family dehydratase N-terminal domain-containing protein [Mesorhizobium sp. M0134]|uniref:MaoC family dehydratase n=1 Tax=Mesorhizobium sp. M0134 TaxID=2956889 RepID=UPI00333DF548
MAIEYDRMMAMNNLGQSFSYGDRDVMLYAYAIGMGSDPLDQAELAFVNEAWAIPRPLKVVPTFASIAAWDAEPQEVTRSLANPVLVLDAERDITFHKQLAPAAEITADCSVNAVYDKGKDKGAIICFRTLLKDNEGQLIATLLTSWFARGDGGFGGPYAERRGPHRVPTRAPDRIIDITTRPDQALLYRLCGDRFPLHSDPEYAKSAGFPRPILHGMCTYGITCRGVLETYADYDPGAFRQHAARFSSPVFPGETLTLELWKEGSVISFEAKVKARGVTVVKNGMTVLN